MVICCIYSLATFSVCIMLNYAVVIHTLDTIATSLYNSLPTSFMAVSSILFAFLDAVMFLMKREEMFRRAIAIQVIFVTVSSVGYAIIVVC